MTDVTGGPPSSDEDRSRHFEWAYAEGGAPWDIGRPQPAFVVLADAGAISGRVLDVGCGTGENALMLAARSHVVVGVDFVANAVAAARAKAAERGLGMATFEVVDALDADAVAALGPFDTVVDCGLFHTFDDADRARYVEVLRAIVVPGGRYHMLCFSDRQPGDWGPRRVSEPELRAAFSSGWRVDAIVPAVLDTTISPDGARAWLGSFSRLP